MCMFKKWKNSVLLKKEDCSLLIIFTVLFNLFINYKIKAIARLYHIHNYATLSCGKYVQG